jgi:hypothetical protein
MRPELYNYEVVPSVFLAGTEKQITVRPLGRHAAFVPGQEYTLRVLQVDRAEERRYAGSAGGRSFTVVPDGDGCLRFRMVFPAESQYFIHIHNSPEERRKVQLCVYALGPDMKGRYPLRGDLHLHSCCSDGREDPLAVAANYRGRGYDFMVLSDHGRYYPSLALRRALGIGPDDRGGITDMLVVPGEEIHLPLNAAHYINFGGSFSVNALVTPSKNEEAGGSDSEFRSLDGVCPDTMTTEEFEAMIRERAEGIDLPLESERLSLAVARWECEQVRAGGGLAIFPHPFWLYSTMQLSESFTRAYYEDGPFDAFEVLGGELYFAQNGFQTALYYEEKAKGFDYPVVGSTDSHGSTENNPKSLICSTIVFSPENTTAALVSSVKERYSVAVDTISPQYGLVGDFRLVKYASFLMENWYPIHDRLCATEGWQLRRLLLGDAASGERESAERVLREMKGQVPALMKKYFDIEE